MDKLLIATTNKGKLREIQDLFAEFNLKLYSLSDFPEITIIPEENGNSFIENANIKARFYAKESGMTTLSDDSGLVIPAINGEPGIYSADWARDYGGFDKAMEKVFIEIKNAGQVALKDPNKISLVDNIEAYFTCVLSLCDNEGSIINFTGKVEGNITYPAKGNKGFGYDPIFTAKNYNKSFAEIDPDEKQAISHRNDAFLQLKEYLLAN